jgi:hypothetical protein
MPEPVMNTLVLKIQNALSVSSIWSMWRGPPQQAVAADTIAFAPLERDDSGLTSENAELHRRFNEADFDYKQLCEFYAGLY